MGFLSFWRVAVQRSHQQHGEPEAERALSLATLDSVLWSVKH
jgi:hypothetical protein